MGQSRASATSNANSKVLRIGMIVEDRARDSIDQMNAIAAIVDEWRAGVSPVYTRTPTGGTCHCDGPPHTWSPGWCPEAGPVTRRA